MVLMKRTKYSLAQFLDLFDADVGHTLLNKYDISLGWAGSYNQIEISSALLRADNDKLGRLLHEVVSTRGDLRNRVEPRYRFDERWNDLTKCLLLDGYRIENESITRIEPFLEGAEPVEDDLSKELQRSGLPACKKVKEQIVDSANDFRKASPDYNGSLSHARIAIETLVRDIAMKKGLNILEKNEKKAWGLSLAYLRENTFISEKQEKTLAFIYTFISPGSHVPIGFTEEEFVRFGRNLAISMCYFMIKLFNGEGSVGVVFF